MLLVKKQRQEVVSLMIQELKFYLKNILTLMSLEIRGLLKSSSYKKEKKILAITVIDTLVSFIKDF